MSILEEIKVNRTPTHMTQPEALKLADWMESNGECMNAAAELRQLHDLNQELLAALKDVISACDVVEYGLALTKARAAIAKGEVK